MPKTVSRQTVFKCQRLHLVSDLQDLIPMLRTTNRQSTMLLRGLFGIAIACCCMLGVAADLQLEPVRVAPGVYVVYGDLKPASYDNDALTVNLGFVATSRSEERRVGKECRL